MLTILDYGSQKGGKTRDSLSTIPFSFGTRACPGQALAKLQSKVLLTYILKNIDYKIDDDILENEYISFSNMSQFKLKFTVTKLL